MKSKSKGLKQVANIHVDIQKFNENTTIQDNGCIFHNGAKHRQGYTFTSVYVEPDMKKKMMTNHRIAATIKYNREILRNEKVLHTCYNNQCVNPDHLFLGDVYDKIKHHKERK